MYRLGTSVCLLGLEAWAAAAHLAQGCRTFCPDVEEEQLADEPISCYNCRYRRWTEAGICCLADRR